MPADRGAAVAVYARTSTDRQEREETVNSQIAACEAYAAINGLTPRQKFVDDGVSGASLIRPALTALREEIRAKRITTIVVYDTDRLSRNLSHLLLLMEEFGKSEAEVVFVKCPLEDTPEGRVLFNIKGVFAEYEREKIRERTLRGKVAYIKQGGWFGPAPFGYRVIKQRLEVDPAEAHWVREMFTLFAAGNSTLHGLARHLNESGVHTRGKSNKRAGWQPEVVRRILNRHLYTGVFSREIRGMPESACQVAVPPIVDATTWDDVQKRLKLNKAEAERSKIHFYLLSGLIRCGVCGHRYYGRHVRRTGARYYRCETNHNVSRFKLPCRNRGVPATGLETAVWNQIVELVTHPEAVLIGERLVGDAAVTDGAASLEEQLFLVRRSQARLDGRKSRVLDLMLDRPQDKAILSRKLDELDAELGELRSREQGLMEGLSNVSSREQRLAGVREAFRSLRRRLDNLSLDDRHRVCRLLIEEIRVFKSGEIAVDWLVPFAEPDAPPGTVDPGVQENADGLIGSVATQDSRG